MHVAEKKKPIKVFWGPRCPHTNTGTGTGAYNHFNAVAVWILEPETVALR